MSDTAFRNFTEKYAVEGVSGVDATSFLKMVKEPVVRKLQEKKNIKFRIVLVCLMEKLSPSGGDPEVKEEHFGDKTTIKLVDNDVNDMYDKASEKIPESMVKYQKEGSGWRPKRVVELEIYTTEYNPVGGSSYIPLLEKLRGKKAVINMKNEDNECFKWSVTRALNPVDRE